MVCGTEVAKVQKRVERIAKKHTKQKKIKQRKCLIFIYIVQCTMYNEFKTNKKNCKLKKPLNTFEIGKLLDGVVHNNGNIINQMSWCTLLQEHAVDLVMPLFMSIGDV